MILSFPNVWLLCLNPANHIHEYNCGFNHILRTLYQRKTLCLFGVQCASIPIAFASLKIVFTSTIVIAIIFREHGSNGKNDDCSSSYVCDCICERKCSDNINQCRPKWCSDRRHSRTGGGILKTWRRPNIGQIWREAVLDMQHDELLADPHLVLGAPHHVCFIVVPLLPAVRRW